MTLTRLTPIDGEAILPLADAKAQVRVSHDDENDLIAALRDAAISDVEVGAGVALAPATYRWEGCTFGQVTNLPVRPVTGIEEVTYHDSAGATVTYTGSRLIGGRAFPAANESWPSAYGYAAIEFAAGPLPDDKQALALAAVRLLLAHWYENRSAVNVGNITTELPLAVRHLTDKLRQVMV